MSSMLALPCSSLSPHQPLPTRLIVERQARIALEAFQRFVSPHVLDQLRRNPDLLNMQGHRREMSILFSDIVGYTALSNSLGEDEIVELLRRYLGPMLDAILEHDGTVDKVNGDGIMAFFADPIQLENSSINAVDCAQAMHDKLNALNEEWAARGLPTLQIRVGIASGEVYCKFWVREVRRIYGDWTNLNLAARLEAKATVGHLHGLPPHLQGDPRTPSLQAGHSDPAQGL